jgi:hypothetical protein
MAGDVRFLGVDWPYRIALTGVGKEALCPNLAGSAEAPRMAAVFMVEIPNR